MSNVRTLAKSFNGGEVTPEFYGQMTDVKFQTGLATIRNFWVLPHGPVANRPGFAFVRAAKHADKKAVVRPFTYSTTQTLAIEMGDQYIRFHTQGATLLVSGVAAWSNATNYDVGDLVVSGGVNYYCITAHINQAPPNATYWYAMPAGDIFEMPTPYLEADLFDIHYEQSQDVFTITHPNYPPSELRRLGATNWQLVVSTFSSALSPPTGVAVTPTGSGSETYSYLVTTVGTAGQDESLISATASTTNNLLTTGNYNTITWLAATGAVRYNVYKQSNGLYGYIGQTDQLSFKDDNITADIGKTPLIQSTPFSGAGNYPASVSYFEQRKTWAQTINKPQNLWMSRSGTENNLAYSIPTRDDDAISFRIAAREANAIRHIVPLTSLLLLTSSAEWRVTSINTDALTPTSFSVRPQSYIGANNVRPLIVNNNVLYVAARGGHMREMSYNFNAQGFASGDLSLRAPHLFDNLDIMDMAYAKSPQPIAYAVSSNGTLLGATYVPEQQIAAWHKHDTYTIAGQSIIESVCVVAEGSEDALYAVIRRVINGSTVRYIERLHTRVFATPADQFFVDCGATYSGAPTSSLSGLSYLEGETVNILADGAVHRPLTVTGGAVTLDNEASIIQIGLPITGDLQTLPLAFETQALGQGRQKNINKVWLRLYQSGAPFVGPSLDKLIEGKIRTTEPYGSPPLLKTGELEIDMKNAWAGDGSAYLRHTNPLALTLVSMTMEVAIGA